MGAVLVLVFSALLAFAGAMLIGAGGNAMGSGDVEAGQPLARAGELIVAGAIAAAFISGRMMA